MSKPSVLVGMSGGVDSSYAAAVLQQQGYAVTGVMLNLWTDPAQGSENRCCSIDSQHLAKRVASQLGIPFYMIDAKNEFRDNVVEEFIKGYYQGITPNPCITCNVKVRWKILIDLADKFGIEWISTGHYAILEHVTGGKSKLIKGIDDTKDQSYVLAMLPRNYLAHTLLPLGEMTKNEVRQKSLQLVLPSASRADSQDLCFLGDMDYRDFLRKHSSLKFEPGDIVDSTGNILGQHGGLPMYTIGQRKGLRIANSLPYYVIAKDISKNRLIVGHIEHKINSSFVVSQTNWLLDHDIGERFECTIKVRYKSSSESARVIVGKGLTAVVEILTRKPIDITPGQAAVFYQDKLCLGGGIIV